jgi:DNA-binding FadR family transcriptional regulator
VPRKRSPNNREAKQADVREPQPNAPEPETKTLQVHPAARMRAADYVFETLSRAILTGELAQDSVLPTQRELSKQFAVSPLVVRQATHRLEELGLVRVRQGSTTTVLDIYASSDLRILQLQLELATPGDKLALAVRENQALFTLSLLALAERRISSKQLDRLEQLCDELTHAPTARELLAFQVQYWGLIATATRNPMLQHQLRWWSGVIRDLEKRDGSASTAPIGASSSVYRGVVRALRRKRGAVDYWLTVLAQLFDWTEAQRGHVMNEPPTKPRSGLNTARPAR